MIQKPVDPRLLRLSRPARRWVGVAAFLSAAAAITTICAGFLIGHITAGIIEGPTPSPTLFIALGVAATLRGLIAWARHRFGHIAAIDVVTDLRARTLRSLALRDPRTLDRAHWRTILSSGIEGLVPYLTGFLPALAATFIATPAALAVIFYVDAPSALIALITLPLIPLFMWLVGTLTQGRTEKRLRDLAVLSEQMLDLVAGLPTLKAFRRTHAPAKEIERLSHAHHRSTMQVLKIAFLSGFVLEFLATLSVALVAVGIGFRLIDGSITLAAGLTVLVIIPEVYNPVREVGSRFHDAQDGLVAAHEVLSEIERPRPQAPTASTLPPHAAPSSDRGIVVNFDRLSVHGRDGTRPKNLCGTAQPGQITVLAGPNASGKSTALLVLLGITTEGVNGHAVAYGPEPIEVPKLWQRVSYLPQRPALSPALVGEAAELSLGQRQRVAFARELERERELLILDEPTAHLDEGNARIMLQRLRKAADSGVTVLLASHDPLVLDAADHIIEVNS